MDIEKDEEEKEAYKRFADKLKMKQLKGEGDRIKELRRMIGEFEKLYGTDISLMPAEMQIKYRQMRREAGLPEISEIELGELEEQKKDKSLVNLANAILKLGMNRKNITGGLLTLSELVLLVKSHTPYKNVKVAAIKKALNKLEKEGLICGLKKLKTGVEIVEFIPMSLNKDQNTLLALASRTGVISFEEAMTKLNWSQERLIRVLESLERANIAKRDPSYASGRKWYFPGFINKE
ncbi:MAG: hypothetical protein ACTSPQ_16885 [Candidatus Helarchaeota archaeon]